MFKNPRDNRTFLTIVLTYALDLVGFSIVFPVLAPLLLDKQLHFFAPDTAEFVKTTVLGLLYAFFGLAQFIGAPTSGALADHYGRYKVFLGSIGLSIIGYLVMALGIFEESLLWLFIGRGLTGLCSGNIALAQSATADLTMPKDRSKAFGILLGVGGLGFVIGPLVGGKLANPQWMHGAAAFLFAAAAALVNFLMVLFFFEETWKPNTESASASLTETFKDIRLVLRVKALRKVLVTEFFFLMGWAFFLVFSPTYLVQKFSIGTDKLGDFYAYMALWWAFGTTYLNKVLTGKFSLFQLSLIGMCIGGITLVMFVSVSPLWAYWVIFAINQIGGAFAWINLGALLSMNASKEMQGRAMGAGGSMWAIGSIIAPLIAGPLAGWNIHLPLLVGAFFILVAFVYFLLNAKAVLKKV